MITGARWTMLGGVAPALLAHVSSTLFESPYKNSATFSQRDLTENLAEVIGGRNLLEAQFVDPPLESLPMGLGKYFPRLERLLYTDEIPAPQMPALVFKPQFDPCEEVKHLRITFRSSSSNTFDWINLFFPNVSELHLNARGFPIQRGVFIDSDQIKALQMRGVTELVVLSCDAVEGEHPSLFENLELFPNLKTLDLRSRSAGVMLGAMVQDGKKVHSIECLKINGLSAKPEVLAGVLAVFPSLRSLFISSGSFRKLAMNGPQESTLFERLKSLGIDCSKKEVYFDPRFARICPRVSEIEIINPRYSLLHDIGEGAVHKSIKKVTVSGNGANHPPSFLGTLFPNVKSLIMAGCGLRTLFSNNLLRDRDFFARIEHLDISKNQEFRSGINNIAAQLQRYRFRFPANDRKPLAPKLKCLDIRGSASFMQAPDWLSRDFPNLSRLRVSDDLFENSSESRLHELLGPLTQLAHLDIEFRADCFPAEDTMLEIRKKLGQPFLLRVAVHFFTRYSSKPIEMEAKQ